MKIRSKYFILIALSVILTQSQAASADNYKLFAQNQPAAEEKSSAAPSKANIHFDAREFDFGTVEQGNSVDHVFVVKNTGTDPLLIDRVQTSCGCTAAVTSAKTILPNETGTIKTTFNSARFNGEINKTITVYSNDSDEPAVRLTIKGKVLTDVVVVPQRELFFGLVEYKKPVSKSFLLTQGGDKPLEVKKVECDLAFAKTEILAGAAGDKKTYQVIVTITEKAPVGRFEGMVKIHTNLASNPVIERQVIGVVKELDAEPAPAAPAAK